MFKPRKTVYYINIYEINFDNFNLIIGDEIKYKNSNKIIGKITKILYNKFGNLNKNDLNNYVVFVKNKLFSCVDIQKNILF